jgi:RecB family endonuclease NucS
MKISGDHKADGSVLVHDDAGGYKPLNCIWREFRPRVAV